MRFLSNDNNIKVFYRYGLRIFLVIILLLCTILLSPHITTSQYGRNLASCNEHPNTRFSKTTRINPNPNLQIPSQIGPNHIFQTDANHDIPSHPPIIFGPNHFFFQEANLKDQYEPDDDPNRANPITPQNNKIEMFKQLHTFHDPNDIDWVYFYGLSELGAYTVSYCFYALNSEGEGSIRMRLFDENGAEEILSNPNINYCWRCLQNGYYYLKLESASPPDIVPFSYSLWIEESFGFIGIAKYSADVYGRVENKNGDGINGLHIIAKSEWESKEDITGSLGSIRERGEIKLKKSMTNGWYFFSQLWLNIPYNFYVTKEGDPNDHLVIPKSIIFSKMNIERHDFQIPFYGDPQPYTHDPSGIQKIYRPWAYRYKVSNYPKDSDPDNDGFTCFEEFLNGTDPADPNCYSIKCKLSTGLNIFPYYRTPDEPYTVSGFYQDFLKELYSVWEYDWDYNSLKKVWRYWDVSSTEVFQMKFNKAYIFYKEEKTEDIFQDVYPVGFSLTQGLNICPVPLNPQRIPYSSYEFISDQAQNGIKSINRFINTQKVEQEAIGTWESTYMFFGRPSGKDFPLSSEDAYLIGVE